MTIACIFEKALGGDQEVYSRATPRPAKPLVRQHLRTAMNKPPGICRGFDGVNCQVMLPLCPGCTVSNPSRQQLFVLGKGALRRWVWSPPGMRIILRRSVSRLRKLRAVRRWSSMRPLMLLWCRGPHDHTSVCDSYRIVGHVAMFALILFHGKRTRTSLDISVQYCHRSQ